MKLRHRDKMTIIIRILDDMLHREPEPKIADLEYAARSIIMELKDE